MAPPPISPSRRIATIDSLPLELLEHILELVHDFDLSRKACDPGTYSDYAGRVRTLSSASLVAQNWRVPAQTVLWSHLIVGSLSRN